MKRVLLLAMIAFFCGCIAGTDFELLEKQCETVQRHKTNYAKVKSLYKGNTIRIKEDLSIEGYVVSLAAPYSCK